MHSLLIFFRGTCYLALVSGIRFRMLEMDDNTLLKKYVERGSEETLRARRAKLSVAFRSKLAG